MTGDSIMIARKPSSLDLRIGGYMGTSFSVVLKRSVLRHVTYGPGYVSEKECSVRPTEEQWTTFLEALDSLRVWRWRERYQSSTMLDGTSWKVEIRWGDKVIKSSGSNSYPRAFQAYLKAVGMLLAGLPFG
jgi:hypothetical protein